MQVCARTSCIKVFIKLQSISEGDCLNVAARFNVITHMEGGDTHRWAPVKGSETTTLDKYVSHTSFVLILCVVYKMQLHQTHTQACTHSLYSLYVGVLKPSFVLTDIRPHRLPAWKASMPAHYNFRGTELFLPCFHAFPTPGFFSTLKYDLLVPERRNYLADCLVAADTCSPLGE